MITEHYSQLQVSERPLWCPTPGVLPESGEDSAWGATPSDTNSQANTESRVAKLEQVYKALSLELRPDFVPEELAELIEITYLSGRAKGEIENAAGYNDESLGLAVAIDSEVRLVLEKAELGRATPSEILRLLEACKMSSAELARVMHIYGYRVEYVEPMLEDVDDAIKSQNGIIYTDPESKFNVTALPATTGKDHLSIGLAMKRTMRIGRVGNTVIKKRTTFVLNLEDSSPLDQKVARYLRKLPLDMPRDLTKRIIQDGYVVPELVRLLADDNFEAVIPMSTTVYACNADNLARIEAERAKKQSEQTLQNDSRLPAFLDQRKRQMADTAMGTNKLWPRELPRQKESIFSVVPGSKLG